MASSEAVTRPGGAARPSEREGLATFIEEVLGAPLPVLVRAFDGSRAGSAVSNVVVDIRSADAVRRMLTAPGQLGLARAYVAGDVDVDGDLYALLGLQDRLRGVRMRPRSWLRLCRLAWSAGALGRMLPPPPEEARARGRLHSRRRDAAAISYHYDLSNDFYRLLLGPSMTYSCAVWREGSVGLDAAQEAKYDLICRKLGLRPDSRLLDVGCGWGGMVIYAAREYGVRASGVTLSAEQAMFAEQRVRAAGLQDRVSIECADYRDIAHGPYDAISSIGMFEHVGAAHLSEYFERMHALLVPGGRLLNHGICRPAGRTPMGRNGFIQRYVFPDGELQEYGDVVSAVQQAGLEVRHAESLREHYALTLRAWVRNLEERYDEAVALVGDGRARVWRLYLAGSALGFEAGNIEVYQTLAVRPDRGRSGMSLRPQW